MVGGWESSIGLHTALNPRLVFHSDDLVCVPLSNPPFSVSSVSCSCDSARRTKPTIVHTAPKVHQATTGQGNPEIQLQCPSLARLKGAYPGLWEDNGEAHDVGVELAMQVAGAEALLRARTTSAGLALDQCVQRGRTGGWGRALDADMSRMLQDILSDDAAPGLDPGWEQQQQQQQHKPEASQTVLLSPAAAALRDRPWRRQPRSAVKFVTSPGGGAAPAPCDTGAVTEIESQAS